MNSSDQGRLEEALGWFRNSIKADRMGHAYIVVGDPAGDARQFAVQALGELFKGAPRGVGPGVHPDVQWIEPIKKSRAISVEQIRDARHRLAQTAFAGGWKACVIVAADRLGVSASNAFLKTLEEPSGRSVFMLLTDRPEALLPTVVSRCQRVALSSEVGNVSDECRRQLVEVLTSDGRGGLRSAVRAKRIEKLLERVRKQIEADMETAAADADSDDALEARIEAKYREARTGILRLVLLWYRDLLFCVCRAGEEHLHFPAFAADLREQARGLCYGEALRNVRTVEAMRRQFDGNMNEGVVLDLGFGRLGLGHR